MTQRHEFQVILKKVQQKLHEVLAKRGVKEQDIKAALKDPKVKKSITKKFKKGEI